MIAGAAGATAGDVDLATRGELRTTLLPAVESSATVLVDLCGCTFIDSTAVHALFDARGRTLARRSTMAIACPPGSPPGLVLDMTASDLFDRFPDRAAGLAFLRSAA